MKDRRSGLLTIIITVLVVCLAGVGLYLALDRGRDDEPLPNDPNVPAEVEDKVAFDLVDYEVFDDAAFTFKFVIAKVRIKDQQPIRYELKDIVTSENLSLSDQASYLDELGKYNIYLGNVGVDFELASNENSAVFDVFVPIRERSLKEVTLTASFAEDVVAIDLTRNLTGKKEQLGYEVDEVISDEKTYQIVVSAAIDITGEELYENDALTSYPSTAQLVAFRLKVQALSEKEVVIEQAEYITTQKSDTFVALDASYNKTEKRANIVGIKIKENDTGYLLFMTLNPDREQITYRGVLRIKINGSWISVDVDL